MKKVATALQALAALAVLVAAVPVTLNQWAIRGERGERAARAAAHASLAQAAMEAKDPMLAARSWTDALALQPGNPAWRAGLVEAHVDAVLQDAGVIASDPIRLHAELADVVTGGGTPSPRSLVAFGRVLQYRGQRDQAKARFQQAATADPEFADAHLYLGDIALKEGKLDQASVALGRALELDPKLTLATFALGQVRLKQDRHDEALELLRGAAKKLPNGKVFYALGQVLVIKEKWREAERALERALAHDRSLAQVHHPLGDAYMENKKLEAAAGAYRLAYERANDVMAFRKLGRLLARTQQAQKALDVWGEVRSLFPGDVEAHCQIGANALGAGQIELSKGAYERCLELGKDEAEFAKMLETARKDLDRVNAVIAAAQAEAQKKAPKRR